MHSYRGGGPRRSAEPPRQASPGGRNHGSDSQQRLADILREKDTVVYFEAARGNAGRPAPRPDLFDGEAESVARRLAKIPASQLRRFFGAVIAIKRRLEIDNALRGDAATGFIRGEMALLRAKAAYTLARQRYDQDADELLRLLGRHGRSIGDRHDFLVFARHFEAVMAFHKVYESGRGA